MTREEACRGARLSLAGLSVVALSSGAVPPAWVRSREPLPDGLGDLDGGRGGPSRRRATTGPA